MKDGWKLEFGEARYPNFGYEARVANWVETRIGTQHMHPRERAMRLLEEAVELAQAESALKASGILADNAPSAVDALIQEVLGDKAALLGKRTKRPSRKSKDPEERKAAAEQQERTRHHDSLAQIARLLGCEGFDAFCALGTLHWAKNRIWNRSNAVGESRSEMAMSLGPLSDEQKRLVGRFIGKQSEASFQAGLRIGLMAHLWTLALLADREPKP